MIILKWKMKNIWLNQHYLLFKLQSWQLNMATKIAEWAVFEDWRLINHRITAHPPQQRGDEFIESAGDWMLFDAIWSDPLHTDRDGMSISLFYLFVFVLNLPNSIRFEAMESGVLFAVFGGGYLSFCWRGIFKEIRVRDHFYRKYSWNHMFFELDLCFPLMMMYDGASALVTDSEQRLSVRLKTHSNGYLWEGLFAVFREGDLNCFAAEELFRKYVFRIISIGNQRLNIVCNW